MTTTAKEATYAITGIVNALEAITDMVEDLSTELSMDGVDANVLAHYAHACRYLSEAEDALQEAMNGSQHSTTTERTEARQVNTIDLTLHADTTTELAEQLAAIARDISTHSSNAIPAPGEESTVLVGGKVVGAISSPGIVTNDDRANLASAERVGNIGILDNAVLAMDALVDALDGDGRELPRSTREGLYAALRLVSESLSERAAFLRENQEMLGFGGEHGDE